MPGLGERKSNTQDILRHFQCAVVETEAQRGRKDLLASPWNIVEFVYLFFLAPCQAWISITHRSAPTQRAREWPCLLLPLPCQGVEWNVTRLAPNPVCRRPLGGALSTILLPLLTGPADPDIVMTRLSLFRECQGKQTLQVSWFFPRITVMSLLHGQPFWFSLFSLPCDHFHFPILPYLASC